MPGVFADVLSDTSNSASVSQPLSNSTVSAVGDVLGTVGSLASGYFDDKAREFRQQDQNDFALFRDERKRAIENQTKFDDNNFLSNVYDKVNRIREGTLQGKFSRLEEATRVRRTLGEAFSNRPDLASDIRQIDNDLSGIDAGDVENSLVHQDEVQKEKLFEETIAKYPHLVSFNTDGTINDDNSFQNVTSHLKYEQELANASQVKALQLQMLQGANVSLDIQQKKTAAVEEEFVRSYRIGAAKRASVEMKSFLEHVRKSKEDGTFDNVSTRQMAFQRIQQGRQEVRLQMLQSGITDDALINSTVETIYGEAGLSAFIKADEFDANSLKTLESIANSNENLWLMENAGEVMRINKVFPTFFDNITNLAFSDGPSKLGAVDLQRETFKNLTNRGVFGDIALGRPTRPLTVQEGESSLPAVTSVLTPKATRNASPEEIEATINLTAAVLTPFGNLVSGLSPDAVEVEQVSRLTDYLTQPETLQSMQNMFDKAPQLFRKLGSSRDLVVIGGKKLGMNINSVASTFVSTQVNKDGTISVVEKNPGVGTSNFSTGNPALDVVDSFTTDFSAGDTSVVKKQAEKFNHYVNAIRFLDSKLGIDPETTQKTIQSLLPQEVQINGGVSQDADGGSAGNDELSVNINNNGGEVQSLGKFQPLTQVE